jgi:D-glycero-D-manno-heptose 1,7-bisphosphate phosphatase
VNRAVFLDLNGTLVSPLKPDALDDLLLLPGAAEAIARLTAAGYVCPVVTVQSRIAKGCSRWQTSRRGSYASPPI